MVDARWSMAWWSLVLAAAVSAVCLWAGPARAQGVVWQPGFPMRAGKQVLLMWAPVPGAEEYRVRRRDLATGQERVWNTPTPQYVDADAPVDRSFLYVVEAVMPGGRPGPSSEPKRVEGFRPLEPPRWGGHYQAEGVVHLVWEAVEGAVFYNLYRGREGETPALLTSVQDLKYADAQVTPGATYVYTIRAVDARSRESRDSKPLVVEVRAGPPRARAAEVTRIFLASVGEIRRGPGYRLQEPTDLAWSDGVLFVTDLGSRSVLVLGPGGEFLYRFAERPPDYDGPWGIPWGIDVSPDGERVAVTFLRSPRVRVFARDGSLLEDWEVGRPKEFREHPEVPQPMDVAWGPDRNLWVTDHAYAQVVRFGPGGKEVGRTGQPRPAEQAGPFRTPTFMAADHERGRVFVVDSLQGRVYVLGREGGILGSWSGAKGEQGRLDLPKGVCVGRDGELLVADGIQFTLQAFSAEGRLRAVYYLEPGQGPLAVRGLVSVAQDPRSGNLFLLSKLDSRIVQLRPAGGGESLH